MGAEEQRQQKFDRMTKTPIPRLIGELAIPTIISMLVTSFYNMADTFFCRQNQHQRHRRRRHRFPADGNDSGVRLLLWTRLRQLHLPPVGCAQL